MEIGFSALVETETGFRFLVETEPGFGALVETETGTVSSWKQKHVARSVAASSFVSSGDGSRLPTEGTEVVGG